MGDVRGSTSRIEGAVAQGTAPVSTDNPVNIGGLASSSAPSAVSTGQICRVWVDLNGRLHILGDLTSNNTAPNANNIGVLPAVANATPLSLTENTQVLLSADLAGNLRIVPGMTTATLAAWNSSTALNATQTIETNSGVASVLVQLTQTTTLSAGAITFEVTYDGTNWITIPADCVIDPTSASFATISLPYTVQASTNKKFLLLLRGSQGLRVKLSTQITGTGTVTPNYALLGSPTIQQISGSVFGAKTNNNAAPGADNVGALTALANAAAPTWTEGDLVTLSVDLSGNLRITGVTTPADAFTNPTTAIPTFSLGGVWNGTKWDEMRGANAAINTTGTGLLGTGLLAFDGTNWQQLFTESSASKNLRVRLYAGANALGTASSGDTSFGTGQLSLLTQSLQYARTSDASNLKQIRTPDTFKTAQVTASGNSAVWTPTTGKKFRIMRYRIAVTGNATQTTGGVITLDLRDSNTTTNLTHDVYVPGTALNTAGDLWATNWIDIGNGILSAAANNVLNLNLSAALTAGNVRIIVCGTEE